MRYDLQNELKRKNFSLAVKRAWDKNLVVDFSVVKQRTLDQNSYLHVALTYLARESGVSLEYAKQVYYKQIWNKDIFRRERFDPMLGKNVEYWRSSAELSVEEMRQSIDNLLVGAARDAQVYIPDPDRPELVAAMQRETWR